MRKLFVLCLLLLASITTSRAVITLQNTFHLGDLDGISGGSAASNTVDGITLQSMTMVGFPIFVTDVPADYPFVDTYAMDFSNGSYGYETNVLTTITNNDNFGLSIWVKPRSIGGNRCIAYNGDTGNNGWGLFQVDDTFQILLGDVAFIGSAPVITNQWTQLALVCDNGVTTLYMDGVAYGSETNLPNTPTGNWAIASSPPSLSGEFFDGLIDEAWVFTFDPGAFSPSDLPYAPPSARTLSAATNGAGDLAITWPTNQSYMQLQATTDLTNWTNVTYTTNASNQFTATTTPGGPAQFFRLIKQPDLNAPVTPPLITLTRTPGTTVTFNPATNPSLSLNSFTTAFTFTASNSINPLTGIFDGLGYHWVILYSASPTPYTDAGITGYRQQTLQVVKEALMQNAGTGITASVTLQISPLGQLNATEEQFAITVENAALTLSVYNDCQQPACDGGINAPGCSCTIPAALPVNEATDPTIARH